MLAIECSGNAPCLNNGTCISQEEDNADRCECAVGFSGEICEGETIIKLLMNEL